MDCSRPAYANPKQLTTVDVDPNFPVVVPCRRDGYGRINAAPPPPTNAPTPTSTFKSTGTPSLAPTPDPMCCASHSYASTDWKSCKNAADPSIGTPSSCNTCLAYQCLDWLPGSQDMRMREQSFYNTSGESVYFGVG